MRPGRFFWKLFLGNAALLVLTLTVSILLIIAEFDRFQAAQLTPYLHNHAATLIQLIGDRFRADNRFQLESLITQITSPHPDAVRITIVTPDGSVLADSQGDATKMENHADRPEIATAMATGLGESARWSQTVGRTLQYVAVRVDREGKPVGVIRVSMPVQTLAEHTGAVWRLFGPLGLVVLMAALGLALGLALLWSSRVRRLTAAAQGLSRGDLVTAIPVSGSDEVSILARSLERMRTRLMNQVTTITRQRRTLESLLAQLGEGVVVVDATGRILLINPAAGRMLNFEGRATGEILTDSRDRVETVISNHDLQDILMRRETVPEFPNLNAPDNFPGASIRLDGPDSQAPTHVIARTSEITLAMPGRTDKGETLDKTETGRLLVLTDVTALIRAIRSRSDFVANASHELRTPVAAIRAAAETLSKMNLALEIDAAMRFVNVVLRHASRLDALVKDLLDLAKVESPAARFDRAVLHLQRVADELHGRWEEALKNKQLRWRSDIAPEASQLTTSSNLLSLVLDNLVDNAIKFTPPGGEISVRSRPADQLIEIEVADTGWGIPEKEQDRVFERFYQVDAVRSGTGDEKRGTGLGLSIVRHAVLAMGGTVMLASEVGHGTKVTISLPRVPQLGGA